MPPKADNPRLDPNFLGDRPGAAPGRRQQNDPSPLQIALQCHRRAATCLKHLAILLRKLDFSCFGYHPDVESRLTLYGKWVLARAELGAEARACRLLAQGRRSLAMQQVGSYFGYTGRGADAFGKAAR